ncbi:MAG: hypothetical protein U0R64_01065 [Candidatus Nanopelagicales bacterium]
MTLRWVAGIAGAVIVLLIARSLVTDLLVPRPVSSPLTRGTRALTQWFISLVAATHWPYRRQHRVLAGLGPIMVIGMLIIAVLGFLLGFTLLLFAFTGQSALQSVIGAGSGLLTLGLSEVVDVGQVIVTFAAALTGMVIIAVIIGYLLVLLTSYQAREAGVTKSSVWAGEPAWGPELLCRRHLSDSGPMDPLGEGWVDWVCQLRVAHTLYPMLVYFRSSGTMRGWVTTLVARMDAAALELAVADSRRDGDLTALVAEGVQTLGVMRVVVDQPRRWRDHEGDPLQFSEPDAGHPRAEALYRAIRLDGDRARMLSHRSATADSCTLTRADFDHAVELMDLVGIPLVADRDAAWDFFRRIRSQYEEDAYRVAERIHSPPAPWSGPRRGDVPTVWPTSSATVLADL